MLRLLWIDCEYPMLFYELIFVDLKTNDAITGGVSKCHGGRDLLLTPTGDIALTEDGHDNMTQRLALWILTPKGELTDPKAGNSYYSYRHAKMTRDNMAFLAGDLLADLRYSFPEWQVKGVECYPTYDVGSRIARNKCAVAIELAEETIDLLMSTDIPEDVWMGVKDFMRYGKLNARMED